MSALSRSRSSAPVLPMRSAIRQSLSPSRRYYSSTLSSQAAPPSSSCFTSRSTYGSLYRSSSPTRLSLIRSSSPGPSVRFSIDRSNSPNSRCSISNVNSRDPIVRPQITGSVRRKTCMCSPTTHPGSFRCSLHKSLSYRPASMPSPSNHLNARRSAMANSLVRAGTVEGDMVKRALAALIRPSSHQQRRRTEFHPRASRLSIMSNS